MENNKNTRGTWSSTLGFLMAAVGSAVGLGNIWSFPYRMGSNGGFAFLIMYLIIVVLCGMCVMIGEIAIGRKTGNGPVEAYRALNKKHTWIGFLGVISPFIIVSFYSVLGGMVLRWCIGYFVGMFGIDGWAGQGTGFFAYFIYQGKSVFLFFALFMLINILIVMGGVKNGIEKFSSIAMPALFAIIIGIVIYIAFQNGAIEGYKFMFEPDFGYLKNNFLHVFKTAASQVFFSLSLGMGITMNYGSYLKKETNIQKSTLTIIVFDTLTAILAGCIILPAVAAFANGQYSQGAGLLFSTMLMVFDNMGGFVGNLFGFLFFFLVLLAAVTSTISLLEVCTTFVIDKRLKKGKSDQRKLVTVIAGITVILVGIPVCLDALGSGNAMIKYPGELFGLKNVPVIVDCWLDLYDGIAEGILMPIGALSMTLLIGWVYKIKMIKDECTIDGNKFVCGKFFEICYKFVAPIILLVVLYGQIMDFFN